MFAEWIPNALNEIEALAMLPEPPSSLVICRAREAVVNQGLAESVPEIDTFKDDGGIGIGMAYLDCDQVVTSQGRLIMVVPEFV